VHPAEELWINGSAGDHEDRVDAAAGEKRGLAVVAPLDDFFGTELGTAIEARPPARLGEHLSIAQASSVSGNEIVIYSAHVSLETAEVFEQRH